MICGSVDHWCVKIFFWNWEMCPSWISNNCNSKSPWAWTELLFVSSSFWWNSKNSITIMIQNLFTSFSTRINFFIELITVCSSPMISSESWNISKSIVIKIERRQMLVTKLLSKKTDQPIPWSRLVVRCNLRGK